MRTRDSFSTRSASASLIFQGLQVQTLKPASVELALAASAGSGSRASRISFPLEAQLLEAKANLLRLRQDIRIFPSPMRSSQLWKMALLHTNSC
jgi:hypothetical protein